MKSFSLSYNKKLLSLAVAGILSGAAVISAGLVEAAIPVAGDLTAQEIPQSEKEPPVDFEASSVEYDDANQIITASGAVEIVQEGRIVKADRVVYDLKKEVVSAEGNVAVMEANGDVHFVEKADLEKSMRNGYVKKLRSVLADGSRFTAEEGHRIDGKRVEMKQATYTPCEPCAAHPEKPPAWQIRAKKVIHDEESHSIIYKNATLEAGGVPVMYVPYFSHADGTIKQKSGLLTPVFNLSSNLGFSATPRYYWAIDKTQDATIGVRTFLEQAPMLLGEYRKRFNNAEIKLEGSTNYSDRIDSSGDKKIHIDDELRGNLFGKGTWDIDDKWRAGFNAALVSDDQYLREYDIPSDDVLENELYAERFDDRNYAVVRTLAFQDLRISNRAADQPNILPEANISFLGKPGDTLGGRWSLNMSVLGLARDGDGQDVLRASTEAGWERKDIFNSGFVNIINANIRGDIYSIPNRDATLLGSGEGDSVSSRFYPVITNETSYPLVNYVDDVQYVVEPTVSLTAATDVENKTDIPNEDSQDVQIDANNIFEPNRFPGLDRVEDKTHATYGVRTGAHLDDGSKAEIFLGQSYRFDKNDNPFPQGSGLDRQESNYVGEINADYQGLYNLNYRFELSSEDLSSERHELDAGAVIDRLYLNTSYFYAKSLEGTDLTTSREQLYGGISYGFTDEWIGTVNGRYDLSEDTKGLRALGGELKYLGQCYTIALNAAKNFTFETTGDNATEIMLRIGLRNVGEFGTSQ